MSLLDRHPVRKLTALLDGELPVAEAARVRGHLDRCASCARAAGAIARVGELARDPVVPRVPGALVFPDEPETAVPSRRPALRVAATFAAAAAAGVLSILLLRARPAPGPPAKPPAAAPLELAAVRLHQERLSGTLSFDMCDGSADEVRTWVCREAGLETQTPAGATHRRACASLVTAAGVPAALVAFESGTRPLTLVTARRQDLAAPAAWPRSPVSLRDAGTGVSLRAWADADQAFVLVSGGPGT